MIDLNFFSRFIAVVLILRNHGGAQALDRKYQDMLVRLNSDNPISNPSEGRVEVSFDSGANWGTICSSAWSFREGNVVCQQLGLGFAAMVNQTTSFGDSKAYPWALVGTLCRGNETRLTECSREATYPTNCTEQNQNVAVVRCVPQSADLALGLRDIELSARLDLAPMTRLTCAMEENCVAAEAYIIRRTQPNAVRNLLRFTTKAENVGDADFSPYSNYRDWEWHQCHQHYHSMNVFATFDIYDLNYRKVAQGHKASFCLMDTSCAPDVSPRYTCGNETQGISIGCADSYTAELDCQWVDVTGLPTNQTYILRIALNPEYKIGERSFENNGAECTVHYTGEIGTTRVTNCRRTGVWFNA
ncbi:PREDICTED: lysyl oxidase homolog 2A-like [Rhagoletis zephyria]|uniref:lysyl oxidase homolog 2A-like n=1 Tax=Rhagoletis zephyria TaxID=28612 RepID=UPI0008112ADC|nr:PREDICTED: lysyl oxidase homolog 2A-like [Rhagoletis zephyria]